MLGETWDWLKIHLLFWKPIPRDSEYYSMNSVYSPVEEGCSDVNAYECYVDSTTIY